MIIYSFRLIIILAFYQFFYKAKTEEFNFLKFKSKLSNIAIRVLRYYKIMFMKPKIYFQVASSGLFLAALLLFEYSDLSFVSNNKTYIFLFVSILLWFIPGFLLPMKSIKKRIIYSNILITFLVLFSLLNLALIFKNPSNLKPYGWIFVSSCFIVSILMNKRASVKKFKGD